LTLDLDRRNYVTN